MAGSKEPRRGPDGLPSRVGGTAGVLGQDGSRLCPAGCHDRPRGRGMFHFGGSTHGLIVSTQVNIQVNSRIAT
jgi:hypothetical protein